MTRENSGHIWRINADRQQNDEIQQNDSGVYEDLLSVSYSNEGVMAFTQDRALISQETSLEVMPDDVFEVETESGLVMYLSAERLESMKVVTQEGDDGHQWRVSERGFADASAERDLNEIKDLALKKLAKLDIKSTLVDKAATGLAEKIEERLIGGGGLFQWNAEKKYWSDIPAKFEKIDLVTPVLIFLHGTASSTEGSFSDLWSLENADEWERLILKYRGNVFAFEHFTLSQGPAENALVLMQALEPLAKNTTLHLVSHSRGGLVGELLCRGQRVHADPFDEQDYQCFDPSYNNTLNQQLKRQNNIEEAREANDRQLDSLKKLNERLLAKKFNIARFIRVSCPARGTTLASGRLDVYLSGLFNFIRFIPGMLTSPVLVFVKTLIVSLAKERADPASLPGLEAMMPESAFIRMLNSSQHETDAALQVIAGESQATGIFKKLGMLMLDVFYRGEHDLVVNTSSMSGGTPRTKTALLRDKGDHVTHFNYFKNRNSRNSILAALIEPSLPAEFIFRMPGTRVSRYLSNAVNRQDTPSVIIIPDIGGSHLLKDDARIWLSREIFTGSFAQADFKNNDNTVVSDGILARYYQQLASFLGRENQVVCLDYDWRKSILDTVEVLASEIQNSLKQSLQPIRIAAHGAGGLVVKALIAIKPKLWSEFALRNGAYVVMFGTPNSGAYSVVRMLSGQSHFTTLLAMSHDGLNEVEWCNQLRRLPGLLELLPQYDGKQYYARQNWETLDKRLAKNFPLGAFLEAPTASSLKDASDTWQVLKTVSLADWSSNIRYVAGYAAQTPSSINFKAEDANFIATAEGDGFTTWKEGIPEGIPSWFMPSQHGELLNTPETFEAISELLTTGKTQKLSRSPIEEGHGSNDFQEILHKKPVSHFPNEVEIGDALLGVEPGQAWNKKSNNPVLEIVVTHGDLAFAQSPVVVGHYEGDSILNAEEALDAQLGGKLKKRHELGLYPGRVGSSEVLLTRCNDTLKGAVVVGLGRIGTLSPGELRHTFRDGIIKYVLVCAEDKKNAQAAERLSCLLIGNSEIGVPMEDIIRALVTGAIEANKILANEKSKQGIYLRQLEFIEAYHEEAVLAQKLLLRLSKNWQLSHVIQVQPHINESEGGVSRLANSEPGWWEHLHVTSDQSGNLIYKVTGKRARAESQLVSTQRLLVDKLVDRSIQSTHTDRKTAQALFELLIPTVFKDNASDNRNIVLGVDDQTAVYPWEILEYRVDGGSYAPSVDAGMVRQLSTEHFQQSPAINRNKQVLVVGDPVSSAPELKGAQREAEAVQKLLQKKNFNVVSCVRKKAMDIISELMTGDFQVLHLAGHGVYQFEQECPWDNSELSANCINQSGTDKKTVTGMLLGDGMFLTAAEILQMPSTPELVFINCCHLGNARDDRHLYAENRHRLAANVATQLIRNGVPAVVAAGWAVDDDAALVFARHFYQAMLDGETFGVATRVAREVTRNTYRDSNTWGAYQCYGDPHFRLSKISGSHDEIVLGKQREEYVCLKEAVIDTNNLTARAKVSQQIGVGRLQNELESIEKAVPDHWLEDAGLLCALGEACGELQIFDRAVNYFRKALRKERSDMPLRAIEQLANFEAKLSLEKSVKMDDSSALEMIEKSIKRLQKIDDICNYESAVREGDDENETTIERLCLLGGCYKRKAMVAGRQKLKRASALGSMTSAYEEADEKYLKWHGTVYGYSRLGLLSGWWAYLVITGKEKDFGDINALKMKIAESQHELIQKKAQSQNYWDKMVFIELDMLAAVVSQSITGNKNSLIQRYKNQFSLAASPRQAQSSLSMLRFLAKMIARLPTAQQGAYRGIETMLRELEKALQDM